MLELTIHTEYITLGQALKLCGAVGSGLDAKFVIQDGLVLVNGEVETRRGKKLRAGDTFTYDNETYVIRYEDHNA